MPTQNHIGNLPDSEGSVAAWGYNYEHQLPYFKRNTSPDVRETRK